MWLQVQSLASLSGLRIWRCHGLWCGLQTRLEFDVAVAVAVAGSCSSDRPPAWEPLYAAGAALKRKKKKENEKKHQVKAG